MAVEIERKFLVNGEGWRQGVEAALRMHQGYISVNADKTVRVRIVDGPDGRRGWLTIKGRARGLARPEFEYEIPFEDGVEMLDLFCQGRTLEKVRHHVPWEGHLWEVDVFEGNNEGLILAEIELDEDDEAFEIPPWVGQEVSGDVRYFNARLVEEPYRSWSDR